MRCEHDHGNGMLCGQKATYRVGDALYCDEHAASHATEANPSKPIVSLEDYMGLTEDEISHLDPDTMIIGDMTTSTHAPTSHEAWDPRDTERTTTIIPPYVTPNNILIGGDTYREWSCPICSTVMRGAHTPLGGAIAQHLAAHQYLDTGLGEDEFLGME